MLGNKETITIYTGASSDSYRIIGSAEVKNFLPFYSFYEKRGEDDEMVEDEKSKNKDTDNEEIKF